MLAGDDPDPLPSGSRPVDVAALVGQTLDDRARAVRRGNRRAFLRTVGDDPAFRRDQRTYFENLAQLPLQVFAYELDAGTLQRSGNAVEVVVEVRTRLEGFDAAVVRSPDRYRFVEDAEGRWLLTSVEDDAWEVRNDVEGAPWDLGPIHVVRGDRVLGIFDEGSMGESDEIVAEAERGLTDVDTQVPLDWPGTVVVYALSDVRVLADLDALPGGDPAQLDGVAFPVPVSPTSSRLAATRFVLHPRMVEHGGLTRERLIRHELTHVAIGSRDDHVPTWLAEGLAEWVSVRPIPMRQRVISRAALDAARKGLTSLPADEDFNGPHSGANYGVSWWACEVIADEYGEETLWRLFDAMRRGDGTTSLTQDAVLHKVLDMGARKLATKAGDRIVATFG